MEGNGTGANAWDRSRGGPRRSSYSAAGVVQATRAPSALPRARVSETRLLILQFMTLTASKGKIGYLRRFPIAAAAKHASGCFELDGCPCTCSSSPSYSHIHSGELDVVATLDERAPVKAVPPSYSTGLFGPSSSLARWAIRSTVWHLRQWQPQ